MKSKSRKSLGLLFCAGLALGLGGCGVGLYKFPAVARLADSQASYPALHPQEVYFFLSKDAFPQDLQSATVGTITTPANSQWTRKDVIREFQKKAAEIGADAIVFDWVRLDHEDFGFQIFQASATAYRLFKQNPQEEVDLSSTQYGTQDPDLRLVK